VPLEETSISQHDKIVNVFHFSKDPSRAHGIPFRVVLRPGETLEDLKRHIQHRLALSDKDVAKIKFNIVSYVGQVKPLEDGKFEDEAGLGYVASDLSTHHADAETIGDFEWPATEFIGLDHPDKSGKSSRFGQFEKAIKIHN
jgi:ubiquitin carboxyl-terminal hydrolase 7